MALTAPALYITSQASSAAIKPSSHITEEFLQQESGHLTPFLLLGSSATLRIYAVTLISEHMTAGYDSDNNSNKHNTKFTPCAVSLHLLHKVVIGFVSDFLVPIVTNSTTRSSNMNMWESLKSNTQDQAVLVGCYAGTMR